MRYLFPMTVPGFSWHKYDFRMLPAHFWSIIFSLIGLGNPSCLSITGAQVDASPLCGEETLRKKALFGLLICPILLSSHLCFPISLLLSNRHCTFKMPISKLSKPANITIELMRMIRQAAWNLKPVCSHSLKRIHSVVDWRRYVMDTAARVTHG